MPNFRRSPYDGIGKLSPAYELGDAVNEPRTRSRISIRATLGAIFGLSVGLALFRLALVGQSGFWATAGSIVFAFTIGLFAAALYDPKTLRAARWSIAAVFAMLMIGALVLNVLAE